MKDMEEGKVARKEKMGGCCDKCGAGWDFKTATLGGVRLANPPKGRLLAGRSGLTLMRTIYVDRASTSAHSTRRARAAAQAKSQRGATPFSDLMFDSREHYEQSKKIFAKDVLHEQ
ncbi:hypothetical protein PIB30_060348 [Stylosanthes scabra]|uniref:Uncharacterized protein n=1 Tax=Stylosanthes scabra TaxID=79078 RepID=A0ABU6ZJ66_9FABA|nr:hypothetical protein [Stylosanthes scabra]